MMLPAARTEASSGLTATRSCVVPRTIRSWYISERLSASTKSHHPVRSHCVVRRSGQLVMKTATFAAKSAISGGSWVSGTWVMAARADVRLDSR